MNSIRTLLRWFLRKEPPTVVRLSEPLGWSFETVVGSGFVTVVIRDEVTGKLIHNQKLPTYRMAGIINAAQRMVSNAERIEPSILKMPLRDTTRVKLRLHKVAD